MRTRLQSPMRIGVLAQPDGLYFRELTRVAEGDKVLALSFAELQSDIKGSRVKVVCGEIDLAELDAIIVRTMPPGSLEQVILRMDMLAVLEAQGTLVMNPPKALETAVDKYLTSARLHAAGIPTPRTIVCQSWEASTVGFEQFGGQGVVKPLFGGEGRGIFLVTDPDAAHRAFKMISQLGGVIYLQEFIDHGGADLRILLIGDDHYCVKRVNQVDWRTNASRGAKTIPHTPTEQQIHLARQAAQIVGAPIAGVDILTASDGRDYVIEVNAVPGWKATASALQVDITKRVMQFVRSEIARKSDCSGG